VTIWTPWRDSFPTFFADLGPKPTPKHTLDRFPDNAGNYQPDNCRWATPAEQNSNKTSNVKLLAFGRTRTIIDWARETGISREVIFKRIREGWPPERILTTPVRRFGSRDEIIPALPACIVAGSVPVSGSISVAPVMPTAEMIEVTRAVQVTQLDLFAQVRR
jgi:hypothetical protein